MIRRFYILYLIAYLYILTMLTIIGKVFSPTENSEDYVIIGAHNLYSYL